MAPGRLGAAEKWAQRNPPSPTATRDALLGWVGFLVIAGLVWLIFSDGPSDRGQRAAEAAQRTVEQQETRAENCRYAGVRCDG